MKNLSKNLFYFITILILLTSCQNVKDGLTGKKQNNSDEFLVEKKNPLVQPPNFNELPKPQKFNNKDKNEDELDLSTIINKKSTSAEETANSKNINTSLEKSILEKIKNN